jgi:hypothetical protein
MTDRRAACVLFGVGLWAAACIGVRAQPAFALSDDDAGPTCAHYTTMGHLAWSREGGDWIDARGELHGPRAFDSQRVAVGRERVVAQWDVTALARQWLEAAAPNIGLLLRAEPSGLKGVVTFHSRESADPGARPQLTLQWAGRPPVVLAPAADSFLDCTAGRSLGARADLRVSLRQSTWLRFDLGAARREGLERAVLQLASDKQFRQGAEIGVFRAAPPYARAQAAVQTGIAAAFAGDAGIERHPQVLFATGFERADWAAEWGELSPHSGADTVAADPRLGFESLSGRALRVRIAQGKKLGLNLRYLFARQPAGEPEEIYFRYHLRFASDWNPSLDGGKLPGIAGTYNQGGWGMRKSDGSNGWSVRGAFSRRPANTPSVAGLTAIGSYAYHVDAAGKSGDHWGWGEGVSGLLHNNRWYAIEQRVKLNTPGKNDGLFEAWIDGHLVHRRNDLRFRDVPTLKIEDIWMNVYHGGTQPAPQDLTLYIDNVVIARRYIGPAR